MLIGIIGAPNKGKSTLFSALTMNDVAIADYPFTTINPNLGVGYATKPCVHLELGVKCNARNSLCTNGVRMFPINLVDVAGLVEGAHEGRGMGNQFLNDLAGADALILVVDASGRTDPAGNRSDGSNPVDDVRIVNEELARWLAGIIGKHMSTLSKRADGTEALYEVLAGIRVSRADIERTASGLSLSTSKPAWSEDNMLKFARALVKVSKPTIIAANKSDAKGSEGNIEALRKEYGGDTVVPCSAAIELALRKAAKAGVIDYTPGARSLKLLDSNTPEERRNAILYMERFLKERGTNVQELLNTATFGLLGNITVYPVEDENKYTDHFGNVLPDGILIKNGSTALDLAERIHTSIAKGMLYAVDAKSKKRLAKDYVLRDNDVIKIVSAAK